MKYIFAMLSLCFLTMLLALPVLAFAAEAEFVALAPLPGLTDQQYSDLPSYLNAVFNFTISIAAILAVIMVMYHGLMYMTKEAVNAKSDHMEGLRGAVFGLILLLMSWLILFVINPQILNLNALKSSPEDTTTQVTTSGSDKRFEALLEEQRIERENQILEGAQEPVIEWNTI